MDNQPMPGIPQFSDGALVLATADIRGVVPTGRTRHEGGAHALDAFAGLMIARYAADCGVYQFYCDADWNVITDTYHDEFGGAFDQAVYEFGPIEFVELPLG
ncbi:hypothetical protein AB0B25_16405 [Nocardia sp. NPDC049190]|uniref:hypothetical protein n=1 Tax=Nocardia sp. NPDC049190 TaxID=3155650 RepID=UPI003401081A